MSLNIVAVCDNEESAKSLINGGKEIGYNIYCEIQDGNDIKNSKPDPEVFLKAAELIGIEPEKCAVIEDAEAGLEAANRAGMLSVAYASAIDCPIGNVKLHDFSDLTRMF
jgi:beta-phosphoglucomutase-like phosphatase (HAD superfamily)